MENQTTKFVAANLSRILHSPRWLAMMFLLPLLAMVHFAIAAPVTEKFDHAKIGFTLNGAHAQARCTACHINNVFKGTPRTCAACHTAGNHMGAIAKPAKHLATNVKCDTCHKTTVWSPAFFSHEGVAPGTCETCHNGADANIKNKSSNATQHMDTTLSCSSCHKSTVSFKNAVSGSPSGHLPTIQACTLCHAGGYGPGSGAMNHAGITNNCNSCHTGQTFAVGMIPKRMQDATTTHITTTADCSGCHSSTTSFVGGSATVLPANHLKTTQACSLCHAAGFGPNSGVMDHKGITNNCTSCHTGQTFAVGMTPKVKPATHVPTAAVTNGIQCETCHSTTVFSSFAGAAMKHTGIMTNCTNCHTGQIFAGVTPVAIPSNHVPTAAVTNGSRCETCHSTTVFSSFAGTAMKHTGITTNCASCHNDGMTFAGVIPKRKQDFPGHIVTTLDCSNCHLSTTTFVGGLQTMPANHLPTTQACTLCHAAGLGPNSGVMNHAGIASNCIACHNGQTFAVAMTPKRKLDAPTLHITTTADCFTCHIGTTTFKGASGGTALPTGHLPTTQVCTLCHVAGFGPNSGVMNHAGNTSTCITCHNGQTFAVGMTPKRKLDAPTPHITTAADCSTCHIGTTTFKGASGGTTLPAGHLPTTIACTLCHVAGYGPNSGVMNHAGITSNCITCHNGQTFTFGMTPMRKQDAPTIHVTTALDCSACHSSTTTFKGASGGTTIPANHIPTSLPCSNCHSAGYSPTLTKMNHTGITTGCATCHSGATFVGPVTPKAKSGLHIPYATKLLGGSAMQCEFCHSSPGAALGSFAPISVSSPTMHNGSTGKGAGQCTGCHLSGTTYIGPVFRMSLTHNSPGHTDCSDSGCHKPLGNIGTSWTKWN